MGDIIILFFAAAYVAACVFFWRDRSRGPQQLTEADIAELEQIIKNYRSGLNL